MPKTPEELQAENDSLRAQLSERNNDQTAKAALAEAKRLRAQIDLSEVENTVKGYVRKGKVTPALANRVLRFAELVIKGDVRHVSLSEPISSKDRRFKLAEGDSDAMDKLDVIGEVVDMLGQLPDAVAMDPAKNVDLEEDPDMNKQDDDDALIAETDKVQAAEPKLSRREAMKKARKILSDRKGGNR